MRQRSLYPKLKYTLHEIVDGVVPQTVVDDIGNRFVNNNLYVVLGH